MANPGDRDAFDRSKLNWEERTSHADVLLMHADLLRLRREDPLFSRNTWDSVDGAPLGAEALVLRYYGDRRDGFDDRLLIVNLGADVEISIVPEPLLAEPRGRAWSILWTSGAMKYGAPETPALQEDDGRWRLPGETAVVLHCPGAARPAPPKEGK